VHSLELINARPKYSFKIGTEIHGTIILLQLKTEMVWKFPLFVEEVLLPENMQMPMGEWATLRVANDGHGRGKFTNKKPLFY
jgi:hypothetical protein